MANFLVHVCVLQVLVIMLAGVASAQVTTFEASYTISTIAGTGVAGYNGDGILATSATLNYPYGVAVNSLGEVLITDSDNARVRKILLNETITTVAGTGGFSYNGEGKLATSTNLDVPTNVVVNSLGEVIISDFNRIRKILLNGTMTNIAGTGSVPYNGDGILATNANLYAPKGLALNTLGEIIIADYYNHRIRKILLNGTIITIAGTGYQGFNGDGKLATSTMLNTPTDVAVNSLGEVFITDKANNRIRKILLNGTMTTIAGTGGFAYNGEGILATSANLDSPHGITLNSLGEVILTDYYVGRIRKILSNGMIHTIAGNGTRGYNGDGRLATSATLNYPYGVAVNSLGEVIFAEFRNHRVRKLTPYCPPNSIKSGQQCNCLAGYFGYGTNDCDKFKCNNIDKDRLDACSSRGQCVSPNTCTCNNGYTGSNCEHPICNGVSAADTVNVCSGHGTCNGVNNCTCSSGWSGSNCSVPQCYGIWASNSSVCGNGNGVCSSVNTCVCQSAFVGKNCTLYNIGTALSISFNATQSYRSETSTIVRVVITNAQLAAIYKTRSVTARFGFTQTSSSFQKAIRNTVVFPAGSPLEAPILSFSEVSTVKVNVQLRDTETDTELSDYVFSTDTLEIVNRKGVVKVASASQSSYLTIAWLICLVITCLF